MDWIYLAKDRGNWRSLVISLINRGVSQNAGNFLSKGKMLGSQEELCCKELVTKIY